MKRFLENFPRESVLIMVCRSYIKYLNSIDSTNRYVRDEAWQLRKEADEADIVAVVAKNQTAGRGQRGNVWSSEDGKNLLLSILVLPHDLYVREQFLLSQVISLAVLHAMRHFGIDAEIKWPNDIYVGRRKLAGILVELDCMSEFVDKAVIGVGLNVNQASFPVMDREPVSMKMLSGYEYLLAEVLGKLVESFEYYYDMLLQGKKDTIAAEYKARLKGFSAPMLYSDGNSVFEAVIKDVEPCGRICLEHASGEVCHYSFKEVELLL